MQTKPKSELNAIVVDGTNVLTSLSDTVTRYT